MSIRQRIKSVLKNIGLGAYLIWEIHKELAKEALSYIFLNDGKSGLLEDKRDVYIPEPPFHYFGPDSFYSLERKQRHISQAFRGTDKENIGKILEEKIGEYERELGGAVISVGFHDFHGRIPDFNINGDNLGWSASTIKVPVMIEVFRAIDYGILSLDDKLTVDHRYPLEMTDAVTRMELGTKLGIDELLMHMIVQSDNEATNMLAYLVGLENINQTMQELGAYKTMMAHLLTMCAPRIYTAWNTDGSNLTTANDLTRLMSHIYRGTAANKKSCAYMREILEIGKHGPLSGYLPNDAVVGSKMGMITDRETGNDTHDTGVINSDYALTVMCNKIGYLKIKEMRESFEKGVRIRRVGREHKRVYEKKDNRKELGEMYKTWLRLREDIEKFHRKNGKLPFFFHITAEPIEYSRRPSDAIEVIKTISKVVYDVYYNRRIK